MTAVRSEQRFRLLPPDGGANALEEELLARWHEEGLFARTLEAHADATSWVFFEGPPTANGRPGIHHVFARTIKDLFCRHRAMSGFRVLRKAGWDTHGLPVEIEVEKQLPSLLRARGMSNEEIARYSGKQLIEAFGVEEFNRLCRESVWKYQGDWEKLSERIGYWLDYDNAYITYTNDYVESVWWALATLHDKGYLTRGHKILPYCPRCGTTLSSHEVALGYQDVSDPSVYVAVDLRSTSAGTGNGVPGTETPRGDTVPGSQFPVPGVYLFKPRETHRFRYTAGFGGVESNRSNPADPQYPPPGAMIDYWVPNGTSGPITLEVVDGSGAVIRRFSSEGAGERQQTPDQAGMRAPEMVTVGTPRLPNAAGLNRFTWDLTLAPPIDPSRERGSGGGGGGRGSGPVIVPGSYTVRLAAAGKTTTQPLTVLIDPREAKDGVTIADLREQLQHNMRVRDMVTEVNQLVASVDSARQRLKTAGGAAADTLRRLDALREKLVTPAIRYSKPELQAHIQYLYSMTTQADQKIGRDAIDRYKTLRAELDRRQAEVKALLGVVKERG